MSELSYPPNMFVLGADSSAAKAAADRPSGGKMTNNEIRYLFWKKVVAATSVVRRKLHADSKTGDLTRPLDWTSWSTIRSPSAF